MTQHVKRRWMLFSILLFSSAGVQAGSHSASSALVAVNTRDSAVWSLAAPAGVQATQNRSDCVAITWNAVYGATGYEVWRATGMTATKQKIATLAAPTCTHPDTGTTAGIMNYYWVTAVNGAGSSPFSSPPAMGCRLSISGTPSAPIIDVSTNRTDGVVISWEGVPGADWYEVNRYHKPLASHRLSPRA